MKKSKMPKGIQPIFFIVFILYIVIFGKLLILHNKYQELDEQEQTIKKNISEKLEEQKDLKEKEEYRKSDAYIEEKAREKFNLIKPGETIYLPKEDD